MILASIVESAVLVCCFDFHRTGHSATVTTYLVWLFAHAGSENEFMAIHSHKMSICVTLYFECFSWWTQNQSFLLVVLRQCKKKLKARFCARGHTQIKGIDFFKSYVSVVLWTAVCLVLIWKFFSKQGYVTVTFFHADLDEDKDIFVEIPHGFKQEGKSWNWKRHSMV